MMHLRIAALALCALTGSLAACAGSPVPRDGGADGGSCWTPPAACDAGVVCGAYPAACMGADACYYGLLQAQTQVEPSCTQDVDCELVNARSRCPNGYPLDLCAAAVAKGQRAAFDARQTEFSAALCDSLGTLCTAPYAAKDCHCVFLGPCRAGCVDGGCAVVTAH